MPNWVDNYITISGSAEDIKAFAEKSQAVHPESVGGDNGEWKMTETPEFSFWNFVRPPQEAIDSGEFFGTHGWSEGKSVGHTPNNWYEWNNREWNTKWDACEVDFQLEETSIAISFNTAWSIPIPVFEAMCRQHPTLEFGFRSQEEQGWGAEFTSMETEDENGEPISELSETNSWDIPESHQDWVDLGDPEGCVCEHADYEDWYDDCPRDDENEQIVAHDADGSVSAEKLRGKFDTEFGGLVKPE
jgi:hypothetical protein